MKGVRSEDVDGCRDGSSDGIGGIQGAGVLVVMGMEEFKVLGWWE